MKLKEFFKPTWNKLLLFFIVEFLFTLIILLGHIPGFIIFILAPTSFLSASLGYMMKNISFSLEAVVLLSLGLSILEVLLLLYRYIITCLIVWVYDKVKKK